MAPSLKASYGIQQSVDNPEDAKAAASRDNRDFASDEKLMIIEEEKVAVDMVNLGKINKQMKKANTFQQVDWEILDCE